MACPHIRRCGLFAQVRLDSTLQVIKSNYCETDTAYARCARFQTAARGEVPAAGLMPSGKILPIFDGPSGVRAATMGPHASVIARDEHYLVATVGQVLVTCWRERITSAGLSAAGAAADSLLLTNDRYAVLNLVDEFVPLPTPRLQQEAAALMAKTGHAVKCSATVLRGESLWVRTARPLLSVMARLALTSYPMGAFSTLEEAAKWIGTHLPSANHPTGVMPQVIEDALQTGEAVSRQQG